MTQYIGQITVIIDADNESIAERSIRDLAQKIEDESEAVVFADHNGDVENYEEIERDCKRSLESGPPPSLASFAPRLLASLITCANLLADYDESEGEEGDAWREAVAAIEQATGGSPDARLPIVIEVRGGVVQDVLNVPAGIEYEIRDYDNPDEASEPGRRA
jgi:hypothetical protein